MATQILAIGTGALDSADQALPAGTLVALKGALHQARVVISVKDDANAYQPVGELSAGAPSKTLTGAGTYRFSRVAGGAASACGVFSG